MAQIYGFCWRLNLTFLQPYNLKRIKKWMYSAIKEALALLEVCLIYVPWCESGEKLVSQPQVLQSSVVKPWCSFPGSSDDKVSAGSAGDLG